MLFSKFKKEDMPQFTRLWQEIFGDEPQDIKEMLHGFVGEKNQYVAKKNDELVAILSAVPVACAGESGVYFFALATKSDFRGQGVMTKLMSFAEEDAVVQGFSFAVLVPAEKSLFRYYNKRCYNNTIYLRKIVWKKKPQKKESQVPNIAKTQDLFILRKKFLIARVVDFSEKSQKYLADDIVKSGALVYYFEHGYAVVYANSKRVLVAEFAAVSQTAANKMLVALALKYKTDIIEITLPEDSTLFLDCGEKCEYAQFKWFLGEQAPQKLYLRFALDDI